MSFQYLSEDQRARYRRFLTDPSPENQERFFYLDAVALAEVAKKRGPHNRLGWAVQWLIEGRVLLPGITTLAPLVTSVRAGQLAAINDYLVEQTPLEMRRELLDTLVVPDRKKVSPLEWMRTAVANMSGTGMKEALNRSSAVWEFGAGAVDTGGVAPVKLTELAAYGMHAKAPKIAQLKGTRRVATLLATMRHLEGVSVDDALLLFDLLMATKLLAKANRDEKNAKLKSLPRLCKAALQAESALRAALDPPMTLPGQPAQGEVGPAGAEPVVRVTTAQEMITRIELVVPIEQLEAALAVIREFLPAEEDDADLAWRAELTSRFASVRGFVELLAETVPWGGTDAGTPGDRCVAGPAAGAGLR